MRHCKVFEGSYQFYSIIPQNTFFLKCLNFIPQADKAWQLYQDCLTKNIPLSVTTYNYIIQLTPLLKDKVPEHKVLILTLLQNMAKDGVKPNLGTLNATLKSISTFSSQGAAKELALSLIAEFESLGIEPGLAAYYYILLIFCRESKYVDHGFYFCKIQSSIFVDDYH